MISNKDLKRILIKSKVTTNDLVEFKESIINSINSLIDSEVDDIEIVQRNEKKWSVIITLENEEEHLYSINMDEILNIW